MVLFHFLKASFLFFCLISRHRRGKRRWKSCNSPPGFFGFPRPRDAGYITRNIRSARKKAAAPALGAAAPVSRFFRCSAQGCAQSPAASA